MEKTLAADSGKVMTVLHGVNESVQGADISGLEHSSWCQVRAYPAPTEQDPDIFYLESVANGSS